MDWGVKVAAASQIFAKFYFSWLKKLVLKSKIVQNYKTSWDFSKFIDIYNIIIDLDTTDGILIVKDPIDFLIFNYSLTVALHRTLPMLAI